MSHEEPAKNELTLRALFSQVKTKFRNWLDKPIEQEPATPRRVFKEIIFVLMIIAMAFGIPYGALFIAKTANAQGAYTERTYMAINAREHCKANLDGCAAELKLVAQQGSWLAYTMLNAHMREAENNKHPDLLKSKDPALLDVVDYRSADLLIMEAPKYLPDYELYTLLKIYKSIWSQVEAAKLMKEAQGNAEKEFSYRRSIKSGLTDQEKSELAICFEKLDARYKDGQTILEDIFGKERWDTCDFGRKYVSRVNKDNRFLED